MDGRRLVFQIGFNRSGTRSITNFFKAHGHSSLHYQRFKPRVHKVKPADLARIMEDNLLSGKPLMKSLDQDYIFFSDMESVMGRKELQKAFLGYTYFDRLFHYYRNSKFIFNYRDVDGWISSRVNHVRYFEEYMRVQGLGPNDLLNHWLEHYYTHTDRVRSFFKEYDPSRLLELDMSEPNMVLGQKIIDFLPELVWKKTPKGLGHYVDNPTSLAAGAVDGRNLSEVVSRFKKYK